MKRSSQILWILALCISLILTKQVLTKKIDVLEAKIDQLEQQLSATQDQLLQLSKDQLRLSDAVLSWLEIWQVDTFEASAYSPLDDRNGLSSWGDGEYMASGAKTAEHIDTAIAVDKNIIPLGTKVWVQGLGWRTALDTGGMIQGKKIDVPVWTFEDAMERGRGNVLVIYPRKEMVDYGY